ncbi:DUF6150 family protein [Pararobbsia silviterrae]|nr:DUF6150 family protein [Pararobbsia silviterrae]
MSEAQFRVTLVDDAARADLLVCRVSSAAEAHGDALWFITSDRQFPGTPVYFCDERQADLKVCFVHARGEAGWRRAHPMQGRLSR